MSSPLFSKEKLKPLKRESKWFDLDTIRCVYTDLDGDEITFDFYYRNDQMSKPAVQIRADEKEGSYNNAAIEISVLNKIIKHGLKKLKERGG